MPDGKKSRAAPRPTIMQGQYIPACTTDGLSQVEVLLVTGESMQEHHGRMRTCAARQIKQGVHSHTMAGYEHLGRAGRVQGIQRRVAYDRRWNGFAHVVSMRRTEEREHQRGR